MNLLSALYDKLRGESDNTASGAMLQSDINRGVLPGRKSNWLDGMQPADLAQLDRYAWGRQAGIGGLPVAAGYEGLKALSQSGLNVLGPVAKGLGFEDTGDQFKQDKTSSPASWDNVKAYAQGAADTPNWLSFLVGE